MALLVALRRLEGSARKKNASTRGGMPATRDEFGFIPSDLEPPSTRRFRGYLSEAEGTNGSCARDGQRARQAARQSIMEIEARRAAEG